MNECSICGLTFSYAKNLHECPKGSQSERFARSEQRRERDSWVQECMRKQREGIKR